MIGLLFSYVENFSYRFAENLLYLLYYILWCRKEPNRNEPLFLFPVEIGTTCIPRKSGAHRVTIGGYFIPQLANYFTTMANILIP